MMLVDIVSEVGWKVCVGYLKVQRVANVSGKSRFDMLEVLESGKSRLGMLSSPGSVVCVKMERIWERLAGMP